MPNKAVLSNFNLLYTQEARNSVPINLQQNVNSVEAPAGRLARACIVAQKISFSSELLVLVKNKPGICFQL